MKVVVLERQGKYITHSNVPKSTNIKKYAVIYSIIVEVEGLTPYEAVEKADANISASMPALALDKMFAEVILKPNEKKDKNGCLYDE